MTNAPGPQRRRLAHPGQWLYGWGGLAGTTGLALAASLAAGCLLLPDGMVGSWRFAGLGAVLVSVGLLVRAERAFTRRLRTVAGVLAAYRQGDYSIQARKFAAHAPLNAVLEELNLLGDSLRKHRLGEIEAWTLLRKVMAEIDVLVLAFDPESRVRLANESVARILHRRLEEILDEPACALGVTEMLEGDAPRLIKDSAALGPGTWILRRGSFRLLGRPHVLIVLSDVSGALRQQERESWKRLIRVMGHEINNSLAPIQSISENLQTTLSRTPRAADWEEDLASGLSIVARRAQGLGRFMAAYAKLARLPPPEFGRVEVTAWVARVVALEQRLPVESLGGPEVSLIADADQLDQLLINLVKNAVEASLETGGSVHISWTIQGPQLRLSIDDEGPGVPEPSNLFVPFFTTKPGGSGIGLALARQIAEAHGGDVTLTNRETSEGARATVRLPVPGDMPPLG